MCLSQSFNSLLTIIQRFNSMLRLLLLAYSVVSSIADHPGEEKLYTYKQICLNNGKLVLLDGVNCKNQVSVGRFQNAVNISGWSFLEVETRKSVDFSIQAYTAGYVEGVLSRTLISYHIHNTVEQYCTNSTAYCRRLNEFLNENQKWISDQLERVAKDDVYWEAVNRTYYQLSGLIDGYEGRGIKPRIIYDIHSIHYLNMIGDLFDLEKKLGKTRDPDDAEGGCSALVKLAPGNKDLFFSHVVMGGFQTMLRVQKLYKFAYEPSFYPGRGVAFVSYPGMVYSYDDYVQMTSGLAIMETTISVYNHSLYKNTKSNGQLLTWIRAYISNLLARNAREWCETFARYNSGTYNNQWIILDYNMFTPGKNLTEFGLLYILEQIPGKIIYRDMTWFLDKYSYFPSYNIPYFKDITVTAGWIEKGEKQGDWFRWGKAPRAKIFDRDHGKVISMDTLTSLMRYNDYTHDALSKCNCNPPYSAQAAISTRGDLNPRNGTYEMPEQGHVNHAALDFKATNTDLMKQLRFRSWAGPTYTNVPAFKWSTCDFDLQHVGHPDEWKFNFTEHRWETNIVWYSRN